MALTLPKTCSMGGSKTGLVGTIGVTLLNPDGTTHTARATAGIYEIGGGCYGKNFSFSDDWIGSIKWDTGGGSPVYAVEEYAYYAHNPKVDTILADTENLFDLDATADAGSPAVGSLADILRRLKWFVSNLWEIDENVSPNTLKMFKDDSTTVGLDFTVYTDSSKSYRDNTP